VPPFTTNSSIALLLLLWHPKSKPLNEPNNAEAAAFSFPNDINYTFFDGRQDFFVRFLRLSFIFDADYAPSFLANDLAVEMFC
jgi:hypothetical protein